MRISTAIYWCGILAILVLVFPLVAKAQEQKVCCSETASGDFCLYTAKSNCKPRALQAAATCDKTSFCRLGCALDKDNGKCFKNTPKFTCEREGNCTWVEAPSCDVPQCQRGCCVLSNECSFVTQLECKRATSQYKDVQMTFKQEVTNEIDCINQCRSFERGACVFADGSCRLSTREGCPVKTTDVVNTTGPKIGFYPNRLCSNPQLGTECAPQQYTGCVPDRDEVYWFDSCGNPENIYSSDKIRSYNNGLLLTKEQSCNPSSNNINNPDCGNCNFVGGTLCGPAGRGVRPRFGDFACRDLTCKQLTVSENTPSANDPGDTKKNGESWCAYDNLVGFGQDTVGSRHYRRMCIGGTELTEPCKDYREELCVQGVEGKPPFGTEESFKLIGKNEFVAGGCRPNRWQGCAEQTRKKDCENLQYRDCFWAGNEKFGKCLPTVPPGLKFWPDEATGKTPGADAKATCEKGNQKCNVVYQISGVLRQRKCVSGCECKTKKFLESTNTICKSLGDCGVYINFLGKGTLDGIDVSKDYDGAKLNEGDLREFGEVIKPTKGKSEYDNKFKAYFGTYRITPLVISVGIGLGAKLAGGHLSGMFVNVVYPEFFGAKAGSTVASTATGQLGIKAPLFTSLDVSAKKALTDEVIKKAATDDMFNKKVFSLYDEMRSAGLIKEPGNIRPAAEKIAQEEFEKDAGQKGLLGISPELLAWINTAMWIWTIYNVLDVLLAKTEQEEISITCKPWVAPYGGSDCEKCQENGKECSEYRCKALGQTCALVNAGTKKEMCINKHPNDVVAPIITADRDALTRGYTLEEQAGQGFRIVQDIEPFTKITLGVKTNEPSQCKYSINNSVMYEQMTSFFGDNLYYYKHNVTFSMSSALADEQILKITNGGKFTFFIRCQDGSGNKNLKDYYVKFAIKKGPDLTPPVIELTSIQNGAYVPAGANETLLTIYTNEPATCKWDRIDSSYETMTKEFTCSNSVLPTSSLYYGLYDCSALLRGIESNRANTFYFKCKDQPNADESKRNVNVESYVFTLRGTIPLEITSVSPATGTELFNPSFLLRAVTAKGAENGIALCGYNFDGDEPANMIDFLATNSSVHEQPFTNLTSGLYNARIFCIDRAGNTANATTRFRVSVDLRQPSISQIYTEQSLLVLITDEPSTCEYSMTGAFSFGSGIQMTGENEMRHEASLDSSIYYITCKDSFNNKGSYIVYV